MREAVQDLLGLELGLVGKRLAPIYPVAEIDPRQFKDLGKLDLIEQRVAPQREPRIVRIIIEVDRADPVIEYIDQIDTDQFIPIHIEDLFAKVMCPINKVFVVLPLGDIAMAPPVLLVFESVVLVVEIEVRPGHHGFLDDDLGLFVAVDRFALRLAGLEISDIDADTFALVTAVADRMKEVFPETSPSPVDHGSRKGLGGVVDILVVHTYGSVGQVGTLIVQHREFC